MRQGFHTAAVISPIHTARWSRKIARKLPECLLCERKHVPGLIPGLIPGWDLVTLPGSVPERALCEQKPDQCRNECVVVMTHFNRSAVLPGVLKADQRSHDEKYVNWNEAANRELLTISAEAEIILQLVKWWARIIHVTWKVTCLYGIFTGCVWMHAHIPENHWQWWMQQIWRSGTNAGTHYPCIFRNLCVKGAIVRQWAAPFVCPREQQ